MEAYSTDFMNFDEVTGHYVLTEKALAAFGTDMRGRLSRNRYVNATAVINRFLTRVSDVIYNYIHKFSFDNKWQDQMIASYDTLRVIIQKAMLEQAEYMLMNGDLTRSVEQEKRDLAIDYSAIQTLNTNVPELGRPITYSGGY